MKSEFLYIKEFESVAHFKTELEKYRTYYSIKRIKDKLKGMNPIQYRIHAHLLPNEKTMSNFWDIVHF